MAKKKSKKNAKKTQKKLVDEFGHPVNEKGQRIGKTGKVLGEQPPELIPYGWKPGQSGNPKGRPPKDKVLTTYLKAQLGCLCSSVELFSNYAIRLNLDPEKTTIGELVSVYLIDQTITGGHFQMRELFNRVDGIQTAFDSTKDPDESALQIVDALSQIKRGKMQPPPEVQKDKAQDAEFTEKDGE